MFPNMRDALRTVGGRRVSGQVIKAKIVDHEAQEQPIDKLRATVTLLPLPARKIMLKPEGERRWKWWQGTTTTKLELGWMVKPDGDGRKVYEVMEEEDLSEARFYAYQFVEGPR